MCSIDRGLKHRQTVGRDKEEWNDLEGGVITLPIFVNNFTDFS